MHSARRDHSDGERLSTPAQLTRSRGSAWFIGLTTLTLGLYVYFGVLVVIDAGAEASEAAHLVGAIGCTAIVAAGLLPQLFAPTRNVAALQQAFVTGVALMVAAAIFGDPDNQGGHALGRARSPQCRRLLGPFSGRDPTSPPSAHANGGWLATRLSKEPLTEEGRRR